jgi:hypothetical protein
MNKRKLLNALAAIFLFVSLGLTAYAGVTINMYRHATPCGKLPGFAGLLQAAHFVPTSDCKVNPDGSCATTSACTISNPPSGGATTGKCTTVQAKNKKPSCVCQ